MSRGYKCTVVVGSFERARLGIAAGNAARGGQHPVLHKKVPCVSFPSCRSREGIAGTFTGRRWAHSIDIVHSGLGNSMTWKMSKAPPGGLRKFGPARPPWTPAREGVSARAPLLSNKSVINVPWMYRSAVRFSRLQPEMNAPDPTRRYATSRPSTTTPAS